MEKRTFSQTTTVKAYMTMYLSLLVGGHQSKFFVLCLLLGGTFGLLQLFLFLSGGFGQFPGQQSIEFRACPDELANDLQK